MHGASEPGDAASRRRELIFAATAAATKSNSDAFLRSVRALKEGGEELGIEEGMGAMSVTPTPIPTHPHPPPQASPNPTFTLRVSRTRCISIRDSAEEVDSAATLRQVGLYLRAQSLQGR